MTQEDRIEFKQKIRNEHARLDLKGMAQTYRDLQGHKERLEAELADVNSEFDILRYESIPEKMDSEGVQNVKFEGIGKITLEGDLFTGIITEHKADFYKWLDEHGFGDIVQPSINSSTLKAFVKAQLKKGVQIPQEYVRATPVTRAKISKA